MKDTRTNILLSLLSLLFLLMMLEVFTRVAVFFYSHDALSFQYGVDSSIKVRHVERGIDFEKIETSVKKKIKEYNKKNNSTEAKITIAALGGLLQQVIVAQTHLLHGRENWKGF